MIIAIITGAGFLIACLLLFFHQKRRKRQDEELEETVSFWKILKSTQSVFKYIDEPREPKLSEILVRFKKDKDE